MIVTRVVEETVIAFCRESLNKDISLVHRVRAGKKDKVRPVIVRFTNRRVRDDVCRSRRLLRDSCEHIYISEHLTNATVTLLKKLHSAWTQHGQVFAKFTSDPSVKPTSIKCSSDFNPRP